MTIQEWFANPTHWCKGAYTQSTGNKVTATCLAGAVIHCHGIQARGEIRNKLLDAVNKLHPGRPIYSLEHFNDVSTYDEVIAVVNEAGV